MSPVCVLRRLLLGTLALACLLGGVAHAQLRIGQPSGFSGSVAAGVKENTDGARLYIDAVNARGGVNGQKIELISVDDTFDPKVTVEVARQLITEQKVLALFLSRGTPHAQALLPLLAQYQVPLVGPSTGAMLLHEPVNPWVFNVRAPLTSAKPSKPSSTWHASASRASRCSRPTTRLAPTPPSGLRKALTKWDKNPCC